MGNWEIKRKKRISEIIAVTYIISFVVFGLAYLSIYGLSAEIRSFIYFLPVLITAVLSLGLINFLRKNMILGSFLESKPVLIEQVITVVALLSVFVAIFVTGFTNNQSKLILLLPVIVASLIYGKLSGLLIAGASGISLMLIDITSGSLLEVDLIYTGLMFLVSWLVGGLSEVEKCTRTRLDQMTNIDELTGLYNHRYFHQMLQEEFKKAKERDMPLSLIFVDIDYFKLYNDAYGYQQGDEALKAIGKLLSEIARRPCFAARYGGEEFAIVLPGENSHQALVVAQRIKNEIENYPFYGSRKHLQRKLTVSMGVSSYPEHANSPKELIRCSDLALYRAKYAGKSRIKLFFSILDDEKHAGNERDRLSSLKTLVSFVNTKDKYTYIHSERVVTYAKRFAQHLGLDEEEISLVKYGAFIHDIGKVEIDPAVLNKEGPLTEEEWATLKQHPVWGNEIVGPSIDLLKSVMPVIVHHHENWDGTGYPFKIAGNSIPLPARILRLADSFDAMTSDRPYKKKKSISDACFEIRKCAGSQFDPILAEEFVQMIQKYYDEENNRLDLNDALSA
ncbi:MAG: diguanylate cyclase [Peptococcaceae bacterium]|jgi:diguanylate cyclase (GGDEF)-like protein|nr:MAG: diguanylate cyclase [Peptococcaceae bacterium]